MKSFFNYSFGTRGSIAFEMTLVHAPQLFISSERLEEADGGQERTLASFLVPEQGYRDTIPHVVYCTSTDPRIK